MMPWGIQQACKKLNARPLVMNWICVSQCTVTLEHLYMSQVPRLVSRRSQVANGTGIFARQRDPGSAITLERQLGRNWLGTGSSGWWSVVVAMCIGVYRKLRSFRMVYNTRMESTFKFHLKGSLKIAFRTSFLILRRPIRLSAPFV